MLIDQKIFRNVDAQEPETRDSIHSFSINAQWGMGTLFLLNVNGEAFPPPPCKLTPHLQ